MNANSQRGIKAIKGTLVSCDPSVKQIILSLDEQQKCIIEELDDTHVLIRSDRLDWLKTELEKEVDPHTLYTSIRSLSRQWKAEVENVLLRKEFTSGRWRVGLRVKRKARKGKIWRGGVVGEEGYQAPGATWHRISETIKDEHVNLTEQKKFEALQRARFEYTQTVLGREGAMEDELPYDLAEQSSSALTYVLPLQFDQYDHDTAMLRFDTGKNDWYAIFEGSEGEGSSGRLDLDFSIVWRFPGDGQNDDESDGWGTPDQENGWLSRFFCSSFDITLEDKIQEKSSKILYSTPLARRFRRKISLQQDSQHPELISSSPPLEWSDEGHEYMSLSLSLGTEFFVRRSAQANFLMRRLEAAALADEDRFKLGKGKDQRRGFNSRATSLINTPRHEATVSSSRDHRAFIKSSRRQGLVPNSIGLQSPSLSSATYASVASTPVSGNSTPINGSSSGPRIVKLSAHSIPYRAPHPSANVSGYSSVLHRPRLDKDLMTKEAEEIDETEKMPLDTLISCSRADGGVCGSSTQSIPRALFSAQLFTVNHDEALRRRQDINWSQDESLPPHRACEYTSTTPLSIWQWSR